ncbi:stage II sporulation protein M [Methanocaldococcus sp.]
MRDAYLMMIIIDSLKEITDLREILKSPIRNKRVVLFVTAIFLISFIVSYLLIDYVPYFSNLGNLLFDSFKKEVEAYGILDTDNNLKLILFIWEHNLSVCIMDYIIGIFSTFVIIFNSYILSYVLYKFGILTFIYLILPHGIFEIPALILSASSGILFNIGIINLLANIKFGTNKEVSYYIKESLKLLILAIILFLIAGIIEGTITYQISKMIH